MKLLLGVDLGTSYFKLGLFDSNGELKGLGRVAVDPQTPAPGRFELSVPAFWDRLRRALVEALTQAGAVAEDIAGISYSSQANSFLLLDYAGTELTPLILWHDQRARPADESTVSFGLSTGYGVNTGMSGIMPECLSVKCRWYASHEATVWERTRSIMTIPEYLTYSLTGDRVGDSGTAALTGLFSLPERSWWSESLEYFGVRRDRLPHPLAPGSISGRTSSKAFELMGLPRGIPYAVGTLDHHAAALGSGLGEFADASLSTGTVLAALMLVDKVVPHQGCIHGPHTDGKRIFRLVFDANGAGQLNDYQKAHASTLDINALLRLAERYSREGRGGAVSHESYVVHGEPVYAILRSIACTQRELLAYLARSTPLRRITATGGGARDPFWLQVTADVIGLPVSVVTTPERACLGAAMLGAVAAGIWPSVDAASRAMIKPSKEYIPKKTDMTPDAGHPC